MDQVVKYNQEQLKVIKQMTVFAEKFADQILKIMYDHQLDKAEGCKMSIYVDPGFDPVPCQIRFGEYDKESGRFELIRQEGEYRAIGKNSLEYEIIFASEKLRSRILENLHDDPPYPPDGLWLSAYDNDPVVDCGV